MEVAHRGALSSLGRYEVAGYLASGGMAEVLLGRVHGPSGFERIVVLKRILPHLARQASFLDMFLDEARIIARIHHPNVVHVHELGTADGELFMVMEYLDGESASSLLRRLRNQDRTLPPRLAAFVAAEACAGLHAAHELTSDDGAALHVVHRDVSPQNVFITFDGAVKVIDFGVAKASNAVAQTEVGQLKGKLQYMSPEQCTSAPIDRRTDVFAMGVVLYELLTGSRLFKRASPAATIRAIVHDPIVPPSRVEAGCPASLEQVCMKALQRSREKRYASALDMRRDLVAALGAFPSDRLPEEDLAALMQDVLSDRRALKSDMIQRIREGSRPTDLPPPEVDDGLDADFDAGPREGEGSSVSASLRARSRRRIVAGALGLGALGVGAVLWRTEARVDARPAPPVGSVVIASAPEPSASVHVSIETDPPGATVVVDGATSGTTPATLAVAKGATPRTLLLKKDGFVDDTETFTADVDQKLRFLLRPIPKPRGVAAARGPSTAPPPKW
jgi:serine/threonine protein kinase